MPPRLRAGLSSGAFRWAADMDCDMLDASFAELSLPGRAASGQPQSDPHLLWGPTSLRGLLRPMPSIFYSAPADEVVVQVSVMPLYLEITALAFLSQDPVLMQSLHCSDPIEAAAHHCASHAIQVG